MKTLTLFLLFIICFSYKSNSQCSVVVEPGSFSVVPAGTNLHKISVSTAYTNGNANAQVYYGCGPSGTVANTLIMCITGWTATNTYKTDVSPSFSCVTSATIKVYARISAYTSSQCGNGNECFILTNTSNLAIALSDFNLNTSGNRDEVCLSWHLFKPDAQNQYLIESSEDGINFNKYGQFTEEETLLSNEQFGLCLKKKVNQNYFRLKVIESNGSITLSPVKKMDASKSSISVSVDHFNNRLKLFGVDPSIAIPYDIINVYGQTIAKGQLTSSTIELPSISRGFYITKLKLNTGDLPLTWMY